MSAGIENGGGDTMVIETADQEHADLSLDEIRKGVEALVEAEREQYGDFNEPDSSLSQATDTNGISSEEILESLEANEDGDAFLTVRLNQDLYCYDHAARRWYVWEANYWKLDRTEAALTAVDSAIEKYEVEAKRREWLERRAEKEKKAEEAASHKALKEKILRRIHDLQTVRRKRNVLVLSAAGPGSLGITGEEWDSDPWTLGCTNGVIDLRTGGLRFGRQSDYIKTVCPTLYKGLDEPAPYWEFFVSGVFDSSPRLVQYSQRLLGYSMLGEVREHILPILHGAGRNGKGTLLETLGYVLGPVAGPVQSEILLEQSHSRSSSGPSPDLMGLRGKRIVWASETGDGQRFDASRAKWLSGGDTIKARALYAKDEVAFTPSHTIFLLTNHKPRADAADYAFWARVHLIPFSLSFVVNPQEPFERERDDKLPEKLRQEASGILSWLIRGCLAWQREGLNPPEEVLQATESYRTNEDILGHFINDRCTISEGSEVRAGALYGEYRSWCGSMNHRPVSGTKFGIQIKKRFASAERRTGIFYLGLCLKT